MMTAELPSFISELLSSEEAEWRQYARCRDEPKDTFFPNAGASHNTARRLCNVCAVQSECLNYALEHGIKFGVWGGKSERERRAVLRSRRQVMEAQSA